MEGRPTVALVNLGCRVNRVELDAMARELEAMGFEVAPQEQAQAVVVNTCAVTAEAEAKARKAVRHAASLPQAPWVVATGCVANLFADELAQLGARVRVQSLKTQVPELVRELVGASSRIGAAASPAAAPLEEGLTPTGRRRPGVKIQDGCDNRCTYCIVWKARGPATSLEPDQCVAQVAQLARSGAAEVVLSGINLGRYRHGVTDLAALLRRLLAETPVGRLRLSSVEPGEVTRELLEVMAGSQGRVAPFLHMPLQAGCDRTLERMGRLYTCEQYAERVRLARSYLPDLALACDLIVGFPGEKDADFGESLRFCQEQDFANLHVFRYSRRPGTRAAAMPDQVAAEAMAERSRAMRQLAAAGRRRYAEARLGQEQLVAVESAGQGVTGGLVTALVGPEAQPGTLVRARAVALLPDGRLDCR